MTIISFILGMCLGTIIGFFLASLCIVSKLADRAVENMRGPCPETVQEAQCRDTSA